MTQHHQDQQPWSPTGWRELPARQQPAYPDKELLQSTLDSLRTLPPLVYPTEIEQLKKQMGAAAAGQRFILQGGDCAERFSECTQANITNKMKILLQMSLILTYGTRKPVVRLGRIAGQYAKPRSSAEETVNGVSYPSYRGDAVNDYELDAARRVPDPQRLMQAYSRSALTLNYIRAMINGGFADLRHAFAWKLHSIEKAKKWEEYRDIVETILDAIHFMESCGVDSYLLASVDFFTSHEGLLLEYESALTHRDPSSGRYYNMGAHMLWIGERTRQLDGAHVEYCRGLANPVGVKIGPDADPEEVIELLRRLNPANEEGKVTLITRMGMERVEKALPPLLRHIHQSKTSVTWSCDPMHGNTRTVSGGIKTRTFDHIEGELESCFRIHQENSSTLAGVHFELTGEDVTECTGGSANLQDKDLARNYVSTCDPRLNYSQSLEMAFLISRQVRLHS
ncbi:3-deoxy-7-phosphoheptulonate synthase class II [Desulfurispira natronophila]|uniref:Phospho-2-dehydro-3-deoxyheptonate aldolase n=1 Tax=Desulfurispira natronophila TaxID=682562 RepID=A0A7W7Y5A4_9BACT|nr:3-deoxy-7-phosphoheptulonate synthase class II [Desulfurispira natronophila]MBB5022363.1 3-deoxy-7-phosphoheptulonate synthase [Desulfurispira natronophila]